MGGRGLAFNDFNLLVCVSEAGGNGVTYGRLAA